MNESRRPSSLPRLTWRTLAVGGVLSGILVSTGIWLGVAQPWQPSNSNPFTTSLIAAMKFPIYYPTKLPAGYHIDRKSIQSPADNVVVMTVLGPKGEKLYISQEARPAKFDLGGFYNSLTELKQVSAPDGGIAVGYNGRTIVGSRANNTTWILSNTNAALPPDQIITTLQSFTHAH
jgi:hypothetical protein